MAVQIKLNKQEEKMLSRLPEASRKSVETSILKSKQDQFNAAETRRREFRTVVTEKGGLSVYGLGQQYPVTLYPDGWEVILNNIEAIKAALAGMPKAE